MPVHPSRWRREGRVVPRLALALALAGAPGACSDTSSKGIELGGDGVAAPDGLGGGSPTGDGTTTAPGVCANHLHCQGLLGPLEVCQVALCEEASGSCFAGDAADGAACDDGDDCTPEARCALGTCVPVISVDVN